MRLAAAAHRESRRAGAAALLEEIFTGGSVRPLPKCVTDALETLANRRPTIADADAVQRS